MNYYHLLSAFHHILEPVNYLEIGIRFGLALQLARPETRTVGVDPAPELQVKLGDQVTVVRETSDDFFARHDVDALLGGRPLALAFIDGMHLFEFALRDFMHLEKFSDERTVILVHDTIPLDARTSLRERETDFWTGDVFKLILCLKKYRPDLKIVNFAAADSGLAMITGLDRHSTVLSEHYQRICEEYLPLGYEAVQDDPAGKLNIAPYRLEEWAREIAAIPGVALDRAERVLRQAAAAEQASRSSAVPELAPAESLVSLFMGEAPDRFDPQRSLSVRVDFSQGAAELHFRPSDCGATARDRYFLVCPSPRPQNFIFFEFKALDADGRPLWRWSADNPLGVRALQQGFLCLAGEHYLFIGLGPEARILFDRIPGETEISEFVITAGMPNPAVVAELVNRGDASLFRL